MYPRTTYPINAKYKLHQKIWLQISKPTVQLWPARQTVSLPDFASWPAGLLVCCPLCLSGRFLTDLDLFALLSFPVALFRGGRLNHNAAATDKRAAIMGGTIEFVKTLKLDRRDDFSGKNRFATAFYPLETEHEVSNMHSRT